LGGDRFLRGKNITDSQRSRPAGPKKGVLKKGPQIKKKKKNRKRVKAL